MSMRLTQVLTTLALAVAATLAVAKPPDLPGKYKVRCEERPGVSAHDGSFVPTQAGYVPGGCIQLDEEQEAGIFDEAEPVEIIDTICPCVGEVIRLWINALQQAFEVPGDNIVGSDSFESRFCVLEYPYGGFERNLSLALLRVFVVPEMAQAATRVVANYQPMPFVMPLLFGAAPQGEDCNCSKKCQCANNCQCANCTEYCACQVEAIGEDEEQAACQCSKGCDCTTDCRCCTGNKCSNDCKCSGEDTPGACEVGSIITSVIGQAVAGKVIVHCQCTDNGVCQIEFQIEEAAACACSKGCSCDAGCECCKDKVCSKTCTCGKPAKRKQIFSCAVGFIDGADDKACECCKDCKCKECACSKVKSCSKACGCGAKFDKRAQVFCGPKVKFKQTSCGTACASACSAVKVCTKNACTKPCQTKAASACGKGCAEACTGDKACSCSKNCSCEKGCECCKDKNCGKGCDCGVKKASGKGCSEACTGDKACACSKNCSCEKGCECCKDKNCGKGCDCGQTTACCPMTKVVIVVFDHLKDSIRESAVEVKVEEPCNFKKKACQSCQHGCGQVRKFVKSCVKQMADGMRQAARGECCEDQPEFPAKDAVKLEKKSTCPYMQKEAEKQAQQQPDAKRGGGLTMTVLDNLQKLQHARRMMRAAQWYERIGQPKMAAFQYERVKKLVPGSRFDVAAGEALAALEKKQGDVFGLAEEEEQGLAATEKKAADLAVECRKAIKDKRWDDARRLADKLAIALSSLVDGVPEPPPVIDENPAPERMPEEQEPFEGCHRGACEDRAVAVAMLLEACQRALAAGCLPEAQILAQQAQMIDPDCVAAHALVYKTHLLIQINQQMQQDAEEQELRLQQGCYPVKKDRPVIFQIDLPPVDPGITDALGKMDRNFQTPGASESSEPDDRPLPGIPAEEEAEEPPFPIEMEDCWPEVGQDPCDRFIEFGDVEECEEESEIMGALNKLIDLMKQGTCVEIGAAPSKGWRLQCQVYVGDATYNLYADETGGMRCTMTEPAAETDLRSAQRNYNDGIIYWIEKMNSLQAQ